MTRRRFFASPSSFDFENHSIKLTAEEARHLRDVLRLKPGDEVYVFDGEGKEFCCSVSKTERDSAEVEIRGEVEPARPESPLNLTLAVALLKGEKFDLVVQKTTELGVSRVVPLITRYADIHLRDEADSHKRVTRWQRIALEAAKQSGRAVVPEIRSPVSFDSLLAGTTGDSLNLMFSERDGGSIADVWLRPGKPQAVVGIVGSEGGWSDEEIQQAGAAGCRVVTLGGRVLRAETAAIATVALVQYIYGDLNCG